MTNALQDLSAALTENVAKFAPSLVSVKSHRSVSSGFIWQPGLVVTAEETLAEDGEARVMLPGGETVATKLVGRDASTDIAVLQIEHVDLPNAALASPALPVGGLAIAIGARDGGPSAALGMISVATGPWRSMRGGDIDARFELDARLPSGGQGGLAVDATGQAFGMVVLGPRRRVLVIPTKTIARVAAQLEKHGHIPRGYLGLSLRPVAIDGAQETGAMVVSVDPKGPGAAAGVFQGDIVVALDGKAIRGPISIQRALGSDNVGKAIALEIRRAGNTHQVSLTIGSRPA